MKKVFKAISSKNQNQGKQLENQDQPIDNENRDEAPEMPVMKWNADGTPNFEHLK